MFDNPPLGIGVLLRFEGAAQVYDGPHAARPEQGRRVVPGQLGQASAPQQLMGADDTAVFGHGPAQIPCIRLSFQVDVNHGRTCPSPQRRYLYVVNSGSAMGPRAWSFAC